MCDTMVSEDVRELLGFPLRCTRFFVGREGGGRTAKFMELCWHTHAGVPGGALMRLWGVLGALRADLGGSWEVLAGSGGGLALRAELGQFFDY